MEKKELTSADVWAMFAKTDRLFEESNKRSEREFEKLREQMEETKQLFDRLGIKAENINAKVEEVSKSNDRLGIKTENINTKVEGISKSNGEFAEEIFYNSLKKNMEFAGVRFDYVSDGFKGMLKMPNGSKLEDQFDIVMINDNAVAIIEVKYKADSDYVEELAGRKIENFRILFPDYKNFDIYLGLGSLSFNEYVVEKAKKFGIGLLKLSGDIVEYKTDWVRAFNV